MPSVVNGHSRYNNEGLVGEDERDDDNTDLLTFEAKATNKRN